MQYVKSQNKIEIHAQNLIQVLFNAYQISNTALSKANPVNLQFNDIPSELNEDFINKNPFSGFYLCLHQEVRPEINRIHQLISDSSYPLSLFTFREYTKQNI